MPDPARKIRKILWLPFVLVYLSIAVVVDGQQRDPLEDEKTLDLTEPVFLPPDHGLVRTLQTARKLLDQERYSEATRALARILDADEDYFVTVQPDIAGEGRNFRSLKNEARQIVGTLPPEGRKSYELQYGITAERLLNQVACSVFAVKPDDFACPVTLD